jgi:hypothetical protein
LQSGFPGFYLRLTAFFAIALTFGALVGCPKKESTPTPAGLYWPAGTPAELAADCRLDREGKKPVEQCKFVVKPATVKFQTR